jgi:type IV secretion system protein VirB5
VNNEFKQPLSNHKPGDGPVSPYQRAKQEWDARIGNAIVQASNWRFATFGTLLLCFLLVFGLIYQSSKSSVVPYIIQVGQNGEVLSVSKAVETNRTPQDNEIKYFLGKWIQDVRGLPLDIVVKKQNWISSYYFMRQSAAVKMNEIIKKDNPMSKVGEQTIAAKLTSIVKMSTQSYQCRWVEEVFSKEGAMLDTYKMTAIITVDFSRPKNEKDIFINPLGLYIKDFSWSKDI